MVAATFSLLGGPLHQIGHRLGLVRGTNTVRLGLLLGVGLWLVIVVLAALGGVLDLVFDRSVVGGHARLLVAIPLFFMCESWVDPRMASFIATIAQTGVVPPTAIDALDAEVRRANRRASAWWPELVWLLAAIVLLASGSRLVTYGTTEVAGAARTSMAALVYFDLGVTLYRFLLFRWLWKLLLWCWFLWRVSRLDLRLIPGHADRAGGLGPLEGVHERLTLLIVAHSVLQCASLAESMSLGTPVSGGPYVWLAIVLLVDAVVFLGPLLVFTDKLWAARTEGVGQYTILGARYVTEFEAKWIRADAPGGADLLGTRDVQAHSDFANVFGIVKNMRWITAGPRLLTMVALAGMVPFAPLLVLKYPVADLAQKVLTRLIGF